jgi:hypothetical protein
MCCGDMANHVCIVVLTGQAVNMTPVFLLLLPLLLLLRPDGQLCAR